MKSNSSPATPTSHIAAITDPVRRGAIETLDVFIRKHAPKLEPHVMAGMLAYGHYHYKGKSSEGEWFYIGIANRKSYISLYLCGVIDGKYIAETHKKELGKVSVGKSCIQFKKLEDLNLGELKVCIKELLSKKSRGVAE